VSDLKRPTVGPFSMVYSDFSDRTEFNSDSEEERYQAFKARLIDEVVARKRSEHTAMWIEQELHDSTTGE
jgi:hypothetical protein